jgi:hypothetical protein
MREIKFFICGIIEIWNISVIRANMKSIIKRLSQIICGLGVMVLLKIKNVHGAVKHLTNGKLASKGNFATIGAMVYGVLKTSKGNMHLILKMVDAKKNNYLELACAIKNGVKQYSKETIIHAKSVEIIQGGISALTILNHLHFIQNSDLKSPMVEHYV